MNLPSPRAGTKIPRNTATGNILLRCMVPSRTAAAAATPSPKPPPSTLSDLPSSSPSQLLDQLDGNGSAGDTASPSATTQLSLPCSLESVSLVVSAAAVDNIAKADLASRSILFRSSSSLLRSLSRRSSSSSRNLRSLRSCSSRSRSRSSLRRRSF